MVDNKRDVFICYASENKTDIIEPFVNSLEESGITYWYDEGEIEWGDSLTSKINEGLRISRFVIVVLSIYSVNKNWPEKELNAALNIEIRSREVKVLPLLNGNRTEQKKILEKYPLINDKKYITWNNNADEIVRQLKNMLNKTSSDGKNDTILKQEQQIPIPIPKIKKKFSDRDKDKYLNKSFTVIKDYFKKALDSLEKQYKEVETELTEIDARKFICKIYVDGDIKSQCKIWIGGLGNSESIGYSEGQYNIDNDGSYNDMLSVEDNNYELGFKPLMNMEYGSKFQDLEYLNSEQISEYLWHKYSKSLEY